MRARNDVGELGMMWKEILKIKKQLQKEQETTTIRKDIKTIIKL